VILWLSPYYHVITFLTILACKGRANKVNSKEPTGYSRKIFGNLPNGVGIPKILLEFLA
jgi:hypothetical protein